MTEREYIEHILKRTEDYIAALRVNVWGAAFAKAHEEWQGTKMALSPFALRGLCQTWIKHDNWALADLEPSAAMVSDADVEAAIAEARRIRPLIEAEKNAGVTISKGEADETLR
jgi:hypothetical protein